MTYKFVFLPDAVRQLHSLDRVVARRILKKLQWLEKLESPLRHATIFRNSKIGDARFRIGDYRVVIIVDERTQRLVIAAVGHRRDIYR